MKIFDITQELFTCSVFPGDNAPQRNVVQSIEQGSICNLTELSMCAHNGTHVDAPYHFYQNGKTIDNIDLSVFVGKCYVTRHNGAVFADDAKRIVENAKSLDSDAVRRILVAGDAYVTSEAARVFAAEKLLLFGNESQTVGPVEAPAQVHYELLGAGMVLLEGIRLDGIDDGVYMLNAAPLNLGGSDGAPCRAILIR